MPRPARTRPEAAPASSRRSEFSTARRDLGKRIKLAREKIGLTQAQLAKKLGVSPGAVGQWEIDLGVPATGRLGALAEFLDVSLDWLLGKPPQGGGTKAADATMADELQLLEEARRLGVDLAQVVAEARQRHWLDENREALTDANAFLARYGLWSDGKRQF